uniref:Uncharacterized protein n=1 Tax=Human betaherpesvirus 6 TaxID=10368 RepID=A0A5P9U3Q7_9BETA|nr:hypothetical protein [Human betaherpesvirus 6]
MPPIPKLAPRLFDTTPTGLEVEVTIASIVVDNAFMQFMDALSCVACELFIFCVSHTGVKPGVFTYAHDWRAAP